MDDLTASDFDAISAAFAEVDATAYGKVVVPTLPVAESMEAAIEHACRRAGNNKPSPMDGIIRRVAATITPHNGATSSREEEILRLQHRPLQHICQLCGNTDQSRFVDDYAAGDKICTGADDAGCGNVVQAHMLYHGNSYRKLDGEEDRSHHGAPSNAHLSSRCNLQTTIADPSANSVLKTTAGIVDSEGYRGAEADGTTRTSYKDGQKLAAFQELRDIAHGLRLGMGALFAAEQAFARFRDSREVVKDFEGVLAACLIIGWRLAAGDAVKTRKPPHVVVAPKSSLSVRRHQELHSANSNKRPRLR